MSGMGPFSHPAINIDRLILDVPGIAPEDVSRLAEKIAAHLARDGRAASDVAIPRIDIVLDDQSTDLDSVAMKIANAVLRRMV